MMPARSASQNLGSNFSPTGVPNLYKVRRRPNPSARHWMLVRAEAFPLQTAQTHAVATVARYTLSSASASRRAPKNRMSGGTDAGARARWRRSKSMALHPREVAMPFSLVRDWMGASGHMERFDNAATSPFRQSARRFSSSTRHPPCSCRRTRQGRLVRIRALDFPGCARPTILRFSGEGKLVCCKRWFDRASLCASESEDAHIAVWCSQALHVLGVACGDHSRGILEGSGDDEGIHRVTRCILAALSRLPPRWAIRRVRSQTRTPRPLCRTKGNGVLTD